MSADATGSPSTSRRRPGILDPQGRAVEGSLGHLGIEGVSAVRVGRRVELTVDGRRRGRGARVVERLAGELLSNPLIEALRRSSRSPGVAPSLAGGAAMTVRIGVVVFPGSNCDRDTLHALELAGAEPVAAVARAGVARRRRRGRPAGRLRVRRLPARRRHRPVQPGHARRRRVRRRRRPRPRHLQRLPGPRRGGARARRAAAQPRRCGSSAATSRSRAERLDTPFTRARRRRGGRCACRSPTARAATSPTTRRSTSSSATARSCSATSTPTGRGRRPDDPANPNGSLRAIAGRDERGGNVAGLMPHPERAVRGDPRLGRRAADHPLARRERGASAAAARPWPVAVAAGAR